MKIEDGLPILEGKPDYNHRELVIAFKNGHVRPMYYARQMYNKTEKGREPRWEDMQGRISGAPSHWMPLPDAPE